MTTTTWQVAASADDIRVYEVAADHPPWDTSSVTAWAINLGYDATNYAGLGARFLNVAIPKGATIISAYLQLFAYVSRSTTTVNLRLAAEAADDAATFSTVADYNARLRTDYVAWSNVGAWINGSWYDSPDIAACIQAVVNRDGWVSGNDLVVFCEDDGTSTEYRQTKSYDALTTDAPKLQITFEVGIPKYKDWKEWWYTQQLVTQFMRPKSRIPKFKPRKTNPPMFAPLVI